MRKRKGKKYNKKDDHNKSDEKEGNEKNGDDNKKLCIRDEMEVGKIHFKL